MQRGRFFLTVAINRFLMENFMDLAGYAARLSLALTPNSCRAYFINRLKFFNSSITSMSVNSCFFVSNAPINSINGWRALIK